MQPLADKIRAKRLEDLVGQQHLLGDDCILDRVIKSGKIPSLILWGPAGCGKTTMARILCENENYFLEKISATSSGSADLKRIFDTAKYKLKDFGKSTILFIDEIHCFKKNQQDLLLPYVEDGSIVLIGATTENPSFEINNALLSRSRVLVFKALTGEDLKKLLLNAEAFLEKKLLLNEEAREFLIDACNGDARYLLNIVEELFDLNREFSVAELVNFIDKKFANYDKKNDNHYNLISAFHKSVRGSDVQTALYWAARMLNAGEHPHYIFRRLTAIASEDIGMADPQALLQVMAGLQAFDFIGLPEGLLSLTHAIVYCATAPKSNAQYLALAEAINDAKINNYQNPPMYILNAPTKMMKEMGYNKGYQYDHDTEFCFSGQHYFPEDLKRREYYRPNERGFERDIKKRMDYWNGLREKLNKK